MHRNLEFFFTPGTTVTVSRLLCQKVVEIRGRKSALYTLTPTFLRRLVEPWVIPLNALCDTPRVISHIFQVLSQSA